MRRRPGHVVAEDDEAYRTVTVEKRPWSPAQLVALLVGLVFVVFGGIALARTGIDLSHISSQHVKVAGAGQTQLMAYIELAYGILLLIAGSVPGGSRGLMSFLGVAALAFGIIVAAQPSTFTPRLGIGDGFGIFLAIVGAVLLLAGWLSPVFWGTEHKAGSRREVMHTP
jgi:hypothetical protein